MTTETSPGAGPDLPDGVCVCGRDIPDTSPSDWACSEPCQSAWLMHTADPDYPHPRDIRQRAEQRAAGGAGAGSPGSPRRGRVDTLPEPVADGTEITVDGERYMRVGAHWQQTGPWSLLRTELAELVEYQRWCPRCEVRRPSLIEPVSAGQVQRCRECDHVWAGRPLVGVVETRGEPWPSIRLRLTDGYRSAGHMWTDDTIAEMTENGRPVADILARYWIRLERKLMDGYADQDRPRADPRQVDLAQRHSRLWDWRAFPILSRGARMSRPDPL